MLQELTHFLSNPINQVIIGIPLSVIGNLTTDSLKIFWSTFNDKSRIEKLENLLYLSFLKALDIHQYRYDSVAKEINKKIKEIIKNNKSDFLNSLKSNKLNDYVLPARFDDAGIQNTFKDAFINYFKEYISDNQKDLVEAIIQDTCIIYKDSFFENISQEQQIWLIFKESFKIDEIVELIKKLETNVPTREQFESIRKYILEKETTSDEIEKLKSDYFDYIERKFASIELKGVSPRVHGQDISFNLDEIFIPLKMKDNDKTKITTFNNSYQNKFRSLFEKSEPLLNEKIELLHNLEKYPRIVLLSDPGGGKSTLLKYIARQICKYHKTNKLLPFYVPIFLRISEYAKILKLNPSKHLLDFLFNDYDKQYKDLFSWAFQNCQALLLMDGLDEVLNVSQRIKVVEEVQDLIARMPENRYIITSRIIGYDEARFSHDIAQFTIQPFDRERVRIFCQCWYKAVSKNTSLNTNSVLDESNKLFEAIIHKSEIEKLACNPLLITIIANIHYKGQTLPYNRVQLYDIATETLLQYWVQSRISDESQIKNKDDVIDILSPIAFYIHKNNPEGIIDESDFDLICKNIFQGDEFGFSIAESKMEIKELKFFLRQQSGFFHEKGIDELTGHKLFGFLHQTFQEYLSGIEIVNQWKEEKLDLKETLLNPRWTECIRLAAGILKSEKGRAGKRNISIFIKSILGYGDANKELKLQSIFIVSFIFIDNLDVNPKEQKMFFESFFNAWQRISEKKSLEEFNSHINSLLKSKYKDNILNIIASILDQSYHPLHLKLAPVLEKNSVLISGARGYFIKFLKSENPKISNNYWKHYEGFTSSAENTLYYDCQYNATGQYGYVPYDPTSLLSNLVNFTELKEILNSIPEDVFLKQFSKLESIIRGYIYIYRSWYYDWYNYPSVEDTIAEIKDQKSLRFHKLCLSHFSKRTDLQKYSDKIKEMYQYIDLNDIEIKKFVKKINACIKA